MPISAGGCTEPLSYNRFELPMLFSWNSIILSATLAFYLLPTITIRVLRVTFVYVYAWLLTLLRGYLFGGDQRPFISAKQIGEERVISPRRDKLFFSVVFILLRTTPVSFSIHPNHSFPEWRVFLKHRPGRSYVLVANGNKISFIWIVILN